MGPPIQSLRFLVISKDFITVVTKSFTPTLETWRYLRTTTRKAFLYVLRKYIGLRTTVSLCEELNKIAENLMSHHFQHQSFCY